MLHAVRERGPWEARNDSRTKVRDIGFVLASELGGLDKYYLLQKQSKKTGPLTVEMG